MKEVQAQDVKLLSSFAKVDEAQVDALLNARLAALNKKIVVLDDDPTGIQTVHSVCVYTDWSEQSLLEGFSAPQSMFFVLTNSRGMTREQTTKTHKEAAQSILAAAKATNKDYIVISRSDSTLRGHYPLETAVLREHLEAGSGVRFDGEIIYPFFKEGGRFTVDDVHYVMEGDKLTPAGETEFARDKSFGYKASYLPEWCEEKSDGEYKAADVLCISLADLRALNLEKITAQLMQARNFQKIIVNSVDYVDVKVFAIAFCDAVAAGKHFLFRSAACITKVLGGIPDRPLLTRQDLVEEGNTNGGIVLIGSHVNKTTQQLEALRESSYPIEFIEFNQHLVLRQGGLEQEVSRVISLVEPRIAKGISVAVYTRRERLDIEGGDKDAQLEISTRISDAVTSIIGKLSVRPSFIIAKGGITSSDVGTKALKVRRAQAMGQVRPGIPVWRTDETSKFAHMPYVIFPGNVGAVEDLRRIVETLMG